MKTVFNINNNEAKQTSTNRIIEISDEQLAFIYFSSSPLEIQQIKIYTPDKKEGIAVLTAGLEQLFDIENKEPYNKLSTSIYLNYKELSLLPQHLHKAENEKDVLNFIYGEAPDSLIFNEAIPNSSIQLLYRMPAAVSSVIGEFYQGTEIKHSTGKQFKIPENNAAQIYCLVGYSYAKIFVYNNNEFLLQRNFHYESADDMAYQLLNTCAQLQFDVAEVRLKLSGFIEANSNLYAAIHKYFLNIHFETVEEAVQINTSAENYPAHMFYPLYQLLPDENN